LELVIGNGKSVLSKIDRFSAIIEGKTDKEFLKDLFKKVK